MGENIKRKVQNSFCCKRFIEDWNQKKDGRIILDVEEKQQRAEGGVGKHTITQLMGWEESKPFVTRGFQDFFNW